MPMGTPIYFMFCLNDGEAEDDPHQTEELLRAILMKGLGDVADEFTIESFVGDEALLYEYWDDFAAQLYAGLSPHR